MDPLHSKIVPFVTAESICKWKRQFCKLAQLIGYMCIVDAIVIDVDVDNVYD